MVNLPSTRNLASSVMRLGFGLTIAVFVTGCAHGGLWRDAGRLPRDAVVLPVAGLEQIGSRCGPNALAMLLNASGDPITESDIAKAILNKKVNATLSLDLLLFARSRGFSADFERGTPGRLLMTLASGRPAILLLNLEPGVPWPLKGRPMWHYVVAYGFSKSRNLLFVHSGVGPKAISLSKLEPLWKPGGYWMMYLSDPTWQTSTTRCP